MRLNKPSPGPAASVTTPWVSIPSSRSAIGRHSHKISFRQFGADKLAHGSAVAHHDNPVTDIDELLGVGRGEEKRVAGLREFRPDAFDLAPRADVDATRRDRS